jgi:hypothetical protein
LDLLLIIFQELNSIHQNPSSKQLAKHKVVKGQLCILPFYIYIYIYHLQGGWAAWLVVTVSSPRSDYLDSGLHHDVQLLFICCGLGQRNFLHIMHALPAPVRVTPTGEIATMIFRSRLMIISSTRAYNY